MTSKKTKSSPKAPKKKPASEKKKTRAGFVAILGAPNAGKSTLLNKMLGQKVSIVTPKAQTTRIRTLGIMTEGDVQITFVDTPGIFAPKNRLDRAMVKAAWDSLDDADTIVLIVDAAARKDEEKIADIVKEFKKRKISAILALNKVDALKSPARLLPQAATLNETGIFSDVFMISALTGDGVEELKEKLKAAMPESPWFYDEDQVSDLPSQVLACEITREQLFMQLQNELPYAAAVLPESLEEKKDGSVVLHQTIVVARESHKPIVVGKDGSKIKAIGQKARAGLSRLFDRKVHLFLEVKVDATWQDRPEFYSTFGLTFGKK